MEKALTDKQSETLHVIAQHTLDHGFPPSVGDIARETGACYRAVYCRLLSLRNKGVIVMNDGKARTVRIQGPWTVYKGRVYREVQL